MGCMSGIAGLVANAAGGLRSASQGRLLGCCPARPRERAMNADLDPLSPAWRDDPYPCYRALRERAPVAWSASTNAWCVSRYDDVMYVLRNPELFSSRAMFTFLMNNGYEGRPPL